MVLVLEGTCAHTRISCANIERLRRAPIRMFVYKQKTRRIHYYGLHQRNKTDFTTTPTVYYYCYYCRLYSRKCGKAITCVLLVYARPGVFCVCILRIAPYLWRPIVNRGKCRWGHNSVNSLTITVNDSLDCSHRPYSHGTKM